MQRKVNALMVSKRMTKNETNTYYELTVPSLIFTDVDETLTHNGELSVEALHALYRLREAGIEVVPITAACSGWCDQIVRFWPIRGIIGENGAFSALKKGSHIQIFDSLSEDDRKLNHQCLLKIVDRVIREIPSFRPAKDNLYRRYDIAIDHSLDNSGVKQEKLDKALAIIDSFGVNASISSMHINIWIGDYNKSSAAINWIKTHKCWCEEELQLRTAFIGNSGEDLSMFKRFKHTIGVSNIRPILSTLTHTPKEIMSLPGGFGFAEWVNHVLDSRKVNG